jgi:hypothetical protein
MLMHFWQRRPPLVASWMQDPAAQPSGLHKDKAQQEVSNNNSM